MAGTVTYKKNKIFNDNERIEEHLWNWTADASDGSVPDTDSSEIVTGWIIMGQTDPGATAPTANYDIVLEDSRGVDVFGAELQNRSATLTEQETPKVGDAYTERIVNSVLTMKLTNNIVNSATGELRVLVRKGSV